MINKFAFALLIAGFASAELPSFAHPCGQRNPNFKECIRNSLEAIKDKLVVGIPEYNVPSLSPIYVKNVTLADLANFKARADNVKIFGFEKFNLKDVNCDLDKKVFSVELTVDQIRVEADYDVNAKILIPVVGHGPIKIIADKLRVSMTLRYKLVERKGKRYIFYYSITTKVYIDDYKIDFKPQGNFDSTLTTAINAALSDSRTEILANTTPNIEKAVSETFLSTINKIFEHFSYDEIFPDRE